MNRVKSCYYLFVGEPHQPDNLTVRDNMNQETLALYIAAIKKEILEDTVLADCKTFAELHDHCDANMLGFESMPEFDTDEQMIDFANVGMNAIDAWLRKGSK